MKVLIMVLSSRQSPYGQLIDAQLKSWDSVFVDNIAVTYYYGHPWIKQSMSQGRSGSLALPCSDDYNMMHWKFKLALDHIWDWEWDFIFRTNSSTYIRKEKIYEFLKDKPREKYYAGENGGGYASGTGAILSRDCADIIRNQFTEDPSPSEDSLIGTYLQRNGIFVQPGPKRLHFNFDEDKILEADYYRCKSPDNDRTKDIYAMNELQKFHYK